MLRMLVRPKWIALTLAGMGFTVLFWELSQWQLHRGEAASGSVQNYGYFVEWLVFVGFGWFGWWRMLQDDLHPERRGLPGAKRANPWAKPVAAQPVSDELAGQTAAAGIPRQGVTAPLLVAGDSSAALFVRAPEEMTTAEIDPEDDEVVAYNAYLAELNSRTAARSRR